MKKTAMLLTACLLAASCMIIHHRDGDGHSDGKK